MKFETKCGIGEIVLTHMTLSGHEQSPGNYRSQPDIMGEVICIAIDRDKTITYFVRIATGITIQCKECELIPDPTFDQETGYPAESDLSR